MVLSYNQLLVGGVSTSFPERCKLSRSPEMWMISTTRPPNLPVRPNKTNPDQPSSRQYKEFGFKLSSFCSKAAFPWACLFTVKTVDSPWRSTESQTCLCNQPLVYLNGKSQGPGTYHDCMEEEQVLSSEWKLWCTLYQRLVLFADVLKKDYYKEIKVCSHDSNDLMSDTATCLLA